MLGKHVLKTWSTTQPTVSLSSGEAEFYGVVKAAGLALGQQSLMKDLGYQLPVRVWTDSSAAIGICSRQGLGKLRHIATHTLWVQERVRSKAFELRKVRGEVNPADISTKHLLGADRVESLMKLFGCEFRQGRAGSAPQLKRAIADAIQLVDGVKDPDARGFEWLDQIPCHDVAVLPHEYSVEDMVSMFPLAIAAEPAHQECNDMDAMDWDLSTPVAPSTTIVSAPMTRSGTTAATAATSPTTTTTVRTSGPCRPSRPMPRPSGR